MWALLAGLRTRPEGCFRKVGAPLPPAWPKYNQSTTEYVRRGTSRSPTRPVARPRTCICLGCVEHVGPAPSRHACACVCGQQLCGGQPTISNSNTHSVLYAHAICPGGSDSSCAPPAWIHASLAGSKALTTPLLPLLPTLLPLPTPCCPVHHPMVRTTARRSWHWCRCQSAGR